MDPVSCQLLKVYLNREDLDSEDPLTPYRLKQELRSRMDFAVQSVHRSLSHRTLTWPDSLSGQIEFAHPLLLERMFYRNEQAVKIFYPLQKHQLPQLLRALPAPKGKEIRVLHYISEGILELFSYLF